MGYQESIMKKTPIEEIKIDEENRLLIRPRLEHDYQYIYRDASGVTWIEELRCLSAREPAKWNHFDLFKQIVSAVQREYGEMLVVTSETKWINIPSTLEREVLERQQLIPTTTRQ